MRAVLTQRIVARANAFVDTWLTTESIHCYILALLQRYQSLQRFEVNVMGSHVQQHTCMA